MQMRWFGGAFLALAGTACAAAVGFPVRPITAGRQALAEDPLPREKTNCVACHLKAGRELTRPVRDFARSVHDLAGFSCNSCHGGNTAEDATAHADEHEFIGTKLSAHMAACADCHAREAEAVKSGPHYWDLSKRINKDYPMCVDCHGNHDIGRPPAEFALMTVCTDCHKQFTEKMPAVAAVVAENDRLWETLRKVQAKNRDGAGGVPDAFRRDVARLRESTARLIHPAGMIPSQQAEALNQRARGLEQKLENWLKEQDKVR
jgi:hypothetical protein